MAGWLAGGLAWLDGWLGWRMASLFAGWLAVWLGWAGIISACVGHIYGFIRT
jgi:hypothetical protein